MPLFQVLMANVFDTIIHKDGSQNLISYYDIYRIALLKMKEQLNSIIHGNLLLKMYINMKKDEKRFGFEINFN